MEGFQSMEDLSTQRIDSRELNTIKNCEFHLEKFKKMPDSRIAKEDYEDEKTVEDMRYNKFRSNYFQVLIGDCEILLSYMDNAEYKDEINKNLTFIMEKVRKQAEKGKITEELIDEMDNLAKNLINKIKSKMS